MTTDAAAVQLDSQGLVTAVCQDADSGRVLMVAYMNAEALRRTLESGQMHFYSRSRQEQWHKGATSGAFLHVRSAQVDCDGDALLFQVSAEGPACHTGKQSCFFTPLDGEPRYERSEPGPGVLLELFQTIRLRQAEMPQGSYTTGLFQAGTQRIAQKVAEEGAEVALDATAGNRDALPGEVADLLYHTLVLLADAGVSPDAVWEELRRRQR